MELYLFWQLVSNVDYTKPAQGRVAQSIIMVLKSPSKYIINGTHFIYDAIFPFNRRKIVQIQI